MKTAKLKPHPLNIALYGKQEPDSEFIGSIRRHGIKEPLVVKADGTIISGHRRWQAAKILNIEEVPCRVENYNSELDEQEALIEYNRQREKTFSQKMAEAEKLKEIEADRARRRQVELAGTRLNAKTDLKEIFPEGSEGKGQTRDKVAEKLGISGRTFDKAIKVWEEAKKGNEEAKELVEKLDKGQTTIHSAYKKITVKKQEKRPIELPKDKYDVILADPPWQYRFSETNSRAIENQYPTMDLEEIKQLKIPSADNSVLFLWATAPKLAEAMEVIKAWGFDYRTCAVWDKEMIGMGYWFRIQHELLLVAVKGNYPTPLPENRFSSVIHEKRGEHSKKPEIVYEMIEKMFPRGKYLELFARNRRRGWTVWGNEVT